MESISALAGPRNCGNGSRLLAIIRTDLKNTKKPNFSTPRSPLNLKSPESPILAPITEETAGVLKDDAKINFKNITMHKEDFQKSILKSNEDKSQGLKNYSQSHELEACGWSAKVNATSYPTITCKNKNNKEPSSTSCSQSIESNPLRLNPTSPLLLHSSQPLSFPTPSPESRPSLMDSNHPTLTSDASTRRLVPTTSVITKAVCENRLQSIESLLGRKIDEKEKEIFQKKAQKTGEIHLEQNLVLNAAECLLNLRESQINDRYAKARRNKKKSIEEQIKKFNSGDIDKSFRKEALSTERTANNLAPSPLRNIILPDNSDEDSVDNENSSVCVAENSDCAGNNDEHKKRSATGNEHDKNAMTGDEKSDKFMESKSQVATNLFGECPKMRMRMDNPDEMDWEPYKSSVELDNNSGSKDLRQGIEKEERFSNQSFDKNGGQVLNQTQQDCVGKDRKAEIGKNELSQRPAVNIDHSPGLKPKVGEGTQIDMLPSQSFKTGSVKGLVQLEQELQKEFQRRIKAEMREKQLSQRVRELEREKHYVDTILPEKRARLLATFKERGLIWRPIQQASA